MRRALCVAFLFALSLLAAGAARATSLGTIEGRVLDEGGGPLPGVTVTVTGDGTSRSVASDAKGEYRVGGLRPGPYRVAFTLAGFSTTARAVTVRAGQTTRADGVLSVGAVAETVQVMAEEGRRERHKSAAPMAGLALAPAAADVQRWAPRSEWNREAYSRIDENAFRSAAAAPLATFGVDVDTASYANVRRFIERGSLPPRDAVRVEELINAFEYDYPEPDGDAPFAVTTEIAPCPWNQSHRLALVALQARRVPLEELPQLNLVFLVDVSGSMSSEDKLPLVRSALGRLVHRLRPEDRVALVVYAGSSGLVLPSTPARDRAAIVGALDRLEAGGPTHGAAGIRLAYEEAVAHHRPGVMSRVVLATDGDFNVGTTSQSELVQLIEEKRKTGVFLSVLGVGTGNYQDERMEALADHGNGNFSYLDSLKEAERVLVRQAAGTLVTVAKDVKIQVEFNPLRVDRYRLIGYENRALRAEDFKDDRKDAGDVGAGHSVTALFEIVPRRGAASPAGVDPLRYQDARRASAAARGDEVMRVALRWKAPDGDSSRPMEVIVREGDGGAPSRSMAFASAVAGFGMLLRDSPFKGSTTWRDVRERAEGARGEDAHGDRAGFVRLVAQAAELARVKTGDLGR